MTVLQPADRRVTIYGRTPETQLERRRCGVTTQRRVSGGEENTEKRRLIRVFVSSPSDVAAERNCVDVAVNHIN
jgi:hypothetical protein